MNTTVPSISWLKQRDTVLNVVILTIGVLGALFHWFNKAILGWELAGDVSKVWLPFADCVLNGGGMYLCHWDNKPPLFHFLNIGFAATESYLLLFFLTMGVANGISAILIWRLSRRWEYDLVGIVSAFLFVTLMAGLTWRINPRNYAVVFLLIAVLVRSPVRSGISVAIAGLFTQFAALFIPAILWLRIDFDNLRYWWIAQFVTAGLGTVIVSFSIVAALWGPDAALTGVRYSMLASGEYVNQYSERGLSLYGNPIAWIHKLYRLFADYLWLLAAGAAGAYAVSFEKLDDTKFGSMILLGTVLTMLPLTIRTAPAYLVLISPFLSILSIFGLKYLFQPSVK